MTSAPSRNRISWRHRAQRWRKEGRRCAARHLRAGRPTLAGCARRTSNVERSVTRAAIEYGTCFWIGRGPKETPLRAAASSMSCQRVSDRRPRGAVLLAGLLPGRKRRRIQVTQDVGRPIWSLSLRVYQLHQDAGRSYICPIDPKLFLPPCILYGEHHQGIECVLGQ